jgi:hypothetical protein
MHPSFSRLLACAREATARTSKPIETIRDLRGVMSESSATFTHWQSKARGVSSNGAQKAELLFGCTVNYILHGKEPRWISGSPGALTAQEPSKQNIYAIRTNPSNSSNLAGSTFTDSLPSDTTSVRAPVVAWALLENVLMKTNREWPEEAFVSFTAITDKVSSHVKAVTVLESPLPTIAPGDRIAVDPQCAPWDDCVVVVRTPTGRPMLRRYRGLAVLGWEAVCPNEPPLDHERHALILLGVVVGLNKLRF